jgi:hypothetical protein
MTMGREQEEARCETHRKKKKGKINSHSRGLNLNY